MTFKKYILLESKAPESHLGDEHEEDEIKFDIKKLMKLSTKYNMHVGTASTFDPVPNLHFHFFEKDQLINNKLLMSYKGYKQKDTLLWKEYDFSGERLTTHYQPLYLKKSFVNELKNTGLNFILKFANDVIYFANINYNPKTGRVLEL